MNNEEKQGLRSSGVLALMGLVAVCLLIILTPWNRHMQDSKVEAALKKAEIVGYQVVQLYREASSSGAHESRHDSRNPASLVKYASFKAEPLRTTGSMGMDPWGVPYQYRILEAPVSGNIRILIWSSGQNKKVETAYLENEDQELPTQPQYGGDDIGLILSIAQ